MESKPNFEAIKRNLEQTSKDLEKKLSGWQSQLSSIIKQAEVVKEKNGKFNKCACTMRLMTDNTVNVIFDKPEEAKKLFA